MARATSKQDGHRATSTRGARRSRATATRAAGRKMLQSAGDEFDVGRDTDAASRLLFAAGVRDMTRAEDVENVASRVGTLSQVVAIAGARDLAHGADLLEAATDVEIMSALVGTMSRSDLERGMELARLSGEMQAAGRIVQRMQMRILSTYLIDRAGVLGDMAVRTMVRSAGTRALATALAVTGADIGELSAQDVAAGITRMAASGALASASGRLAAEGETQATVAEKEIMEGATLRDVAREEKTDAAAEALVGTAAMGASRTMGG